MPKDTLAARTAQRRMGRRPRRWEPGDPKTAQNVTVSAGPLAALAGGAGAAAAGAMDSGAGLAASAPAIPYDGATNMSVGNPLRGNINLGSFAGPRMNPEFDPTKPLAEMGSPYKPTTGVGGFFRRLVGDNSNALNKQFAAQRSGLMLQEGAENRALMAQQAEAQAQFKQQEALKKMEIAALDKRSQAQIAAEIQRQELADVNAKRRADADNYLRMQQIGITGQQANAQAGINQRMADYETSRPLATLRPGETSVFPRGAGMLTNPTPMDPSERMLRAAQGLPIPPEIPFKTPLELFANESGQALDVIDADEMSNRPPKNGGMPPQVGLAAPQTGPKASTVAEGAGAPDSEPRMAPPLTAPSPTPSSTPSPTKPLAAPAEFEPVPNREPRMIDFILGYADERTGQWIPQPRKAASQKPLTSWDKR